MTEPGSVAERRSSPAEPPWHALEATEALSRLGSGPEGLAEKEAARRLAMHGPNELPAAPPTSLWRLFADQLRSLVVWILLGAAALSGILGEWVDFAAITAIVLLNAAIGFYQELRAERALAALRRLAAPAARVLRGGGLRVIPSAEVVPGDVLELEAGDRVAADARILIAHSLRCAEAPLTGESVPVGKSADPVPAGDAPLGDRRSMVYAGTPVVAGRARAVAACTGSGTEIGRIAALMRTAEEGETPLARRLAAFGRTLVVASLAAVCLVLLLGLWRGTPFLEMLLTSASLAVAAVPEGLPAIVTISLAVGVQRMARRNALVRRLPVVEALGTATVICADKTGTLTMDEMTVRELRLPGASLEVTGEGYAPAGEVRRSGRPLSASESAAAKELLLALAASSSARIVQEEGAWKAQGDPTEAALLSAAGKVGIRREEMDRELPPAAEFPFDSDRKRMSIVRRLQEGRLRSFVKGAPDLLLARCDRILLDGSERPLDERSREETLAEIARMAESGLRVLAGARRDLAAVPSGAEEAESGLVLLGLAGMKDPLRSEVPDALARCRAAGIRVVMITGDHPRTALSIAREAGIAPEEGRSRVLTGAELDRMTDAELRALAPLVPVYSRVAAEHKLRIVRAWRSWGGVVAMTGDGVNDAPALRGADIGIAMGRTGTEVAREASDMVLLDDRFASIVAAVEEGRGIYANIRKTLLYLLSGNAGEILLMTACVLLGFPVPLLPVHLLWINLVTDGLPALCLATDPFDADLMRRAPRAARERIADGPFWGWVLATALLTAGASLWAFLGALGTEGLAAARSHAFTVLVLAELFRAFGARSDRRSAFETGLRSNLRLTLVVAASFALQIASHHHAGLGALLKVPPMAWGDCLRLTALSLAPFAVLELAKGILRLRGTR